MRGPTTGTWLDAVLCRLAVNEPIKLAGTPGTKSSVFNRNGRIRVNDLYAIERSSNVYMFKIALLSAGLQYSPGMPLRVMPEKFNLFRSGYSQFGHRIVVLEV